VEWNETFCSSLSRSTFIASTFLDSLKRLQPPPTTTPSSIAACHVPTKKVKHINGGKSTCYYSHEKEIPWLRLKHLLFLVVYPSTLLVFVLLPMICIQVAKRYMNYLHGNRILKFQNLQTK